MKSSKSISIIKRDDNIKSLEIEFTEKIDILELLNDINSVNIDNVMYNASDVRQANIDKLTLCKALRDKHKCCIDYFVHPDVAYMLTNVSIDNSFLKENGKNSILPDDDYRILYISTSTYITQMRRLITSSDRICEIDLFKEELHTTMDKNLFVVCGRKIRGIMFISTLDSDVLLKLEKALKDGNLEIEPNPIRHNRVQVNIRE